MKYPTDLQTLITYLRKLPGVGNKTAERYAFALLDWKEKDLIDISSLLGTLRTRVKACATCGCLQDHNHCPFCVGRDTNVLCIISSPKDAYAIEDTHAYRGLYHVIETLISPLDGRTPDQLDLPKLKNRIQTHGIKEVIIALDSTLEGDATALFLKNDFDNQALNVTRLAFGMPMGSTLDYIDEGTLSLAITGRRTF
ncbi:MAG TPA: recombination mediator RecR [Chlamydiales bacterium]|nr:recombination mediator RecR [Chlamydiales bacterium]